MSPAVYCLILYDCYLAFHQKILHDCWMGDTILWIMKNAKNILICIKHSLFVFQYVINNISINPKHTLQCKNPGKRNNQDRQRPADIGGRSEEGGQFAQPQFNNVLLIKCNFFLGATHPLLRKQIHIQCVHITWHQHSKTCLGPNRTQPSSHLFQ